MINWQLSKRQVLEVTKHSRNGTSVQMIVLSPADSSYGIFQYILPTNHINVSPFDSVIEFEGNTVNHILEVLTSSCTVDTIQFVKPTLHALKCEHNRFTIYRMFRHFLSAIIRESLHRLKLYLSNWSLMWGTVTARTDIFSISTKTIFWFTNKENNVQTRSTSWNMSTTDILRTYINRIRHSNIYSLFVTVHSTQRRCLTWKKRTGHTARQHTSIPLVMNKHQTSHTLTPVRCFIILKIRHK